MGGLHVRSSWKRLIAVGLLTFLGDGACNGSTAAAVDAAPVEAAPADADAVDAAPSSTPPAPTITLKCGTSACLR
jgi:hypothetical protein